MQSISAKISPNRYEPTMSTSNTFGRLFIGTFVAALLSGISTVQTVTFLTANKRDPVRHQLMVVLLWLLDTLNTIFAAHVVYYYLITEPIILTQAPMIIWSMPAYLLLQMLIMPSTQSLYVMRIWKIVPHHRRWLPIILSFLVVVNLVMGIYVGAQMFREKLLWDMSKFIFKWAVYATLSSTLATDIMIAATLIHALATSKTNLRWTDSSPTMFLAYVINSGALVSVFSIVGLIAFPVLEYFVYLPLELVLTRFYFNCAMGMLNACHYLQSNDGNHEYTTPLFPQSTDQSYMNMSSVHNVPRTRHDNPPTINELGLPLFSRASTSSEDQDTESSARAINIRVQREDHSSQI